MSKQFLYKLIIIKAIGYHVITTSLTIVLVLIFTGSMEWSALGLLAVVNFTLKITLYVGWDRLWFPIFERFKKQHAVREAQKLQRSKEDKEELS